MHNPSFIKTWTERRIARVSGQLNICSSSNGFQCRTLDVCRLDQTSDLFLLLERDLLYFVYKLQSCSNLKTSSCCRMLCLTRGVWSDDKGTNDKRKSLGVAFIKGHHFQILLFVLYCCCILFSKSLIGLYFNSKEATYIKRTVTLYVNYYLFFLVFCWQKVILKHFIHYSKNQELSLT